MRRWRRHQSTPSRVALVGRLREQSGKMEGVKMDMDELESELREAQQQVSCNTMNFVSQNYNCYIYEPSFLVHFSRTLFL